MTLMRADAQNRQGRNCSARPGTSVIGGAVDAMRSSTIHRLRLRLRRCSRSPRDGR